MLAIPERRWSVRAALRWISQLLGWVRHLARGGWGRPRRSPPLPAWEPHLPHACIIPDWDEASASLPAYRVIAETTRGERISLHVHAQDTAEATRKITLWEYCPTGIIIQHVLSVEPHDLPS